MAGKEKERGLFRTSKQYPEYLSKAEQQRLVEESLSNLRLLERNNVGRESVTRSVSRNEPLQIIVASDWHIGSLASDLDSILAMRDYILKNDNVGVVFAGDEIEGMVGKYLNTNAARTPIDAQLQIDYLRSKIFEPLAAQGKVLGMVSGYWAHPGWAMDATTINTWMTMVGDLDIPIIQNGGELIIKFPNRYLHKLRLWHNPPASSKFDEIHGLREAVMNLSESSRPDGAIGGHIHRMGVAKESYAGAKARIYYISAGAMKGSSSNQPRDRFGENLGKGLADPQGQGMIVQPRVGRRDERVYPFASMKHGEVGIKAMTLLNRAESQGITEELIEKIHNEVESKPVITYSPAMSRLGGIFTEEKPPRNFTVGKNTIMNPYSKMEMKSPFNTLSYDIQTTLPIALDFISNARLGSTTEGYKDLKIHMDEVVKNPHSLVVYLRNMIDRDAGKSPDRVRILDRFRDLISGTEEQTLAIMMDESMRMNSWKNSVYSGGAEEYVNERGQTKTRRVYLPPLAPASYMSNQTGVPLIHHLSLIKLGVGPGTNLKDKPLYVGAFPDKMEGYSSGSKPEWGLQRLYDLQLHEKPGYVAGGHMFNSGVMTFFDRSNAETDYPILIAPGWWSKSADAKGKGNMKPGSEPGQGIILLPGLTKSDYLAIATENKEETKFMLAGLTLVYGLERLGLTEKVLGRRRR